MCLFFSGLCINRNVINNKFYEILRTDGKFEDERFIKPRKIVPIYENAKRRALTKLLKKYNKPPIMIFVNHKAETEKL